MLRRTYLRLGAVTAHDPAARTVELRTHDGDREKMRYDQLVLALGSVSRLLPVPGLERAIGFKSLADAIWLRNHVIETLEAANAAEDPAHRTSSSPTSSSAAATPASRRSRSSRTSPSTRWTATRARGCTG